MRDIRAIATEIQHEAPRLRTEDPNTLRALRQELRSHPDWASFRRKRAEERHARLDNRISRDWGAAAPPEPRRSQEIVSGLEVA